MIEDQSVLRAGYARSLCVQRRPLGSERGVHHSLHHERGAPTLLQVGGRQHSSDSRGVPLRHGLVPDRQSAELRHFTVYRRHAHGDGRGLGLRGTDRRRGWNLHCGDRHRTRAEYSPQCDGGSRRDSVCGVRLLRCHDDRLLFGPRRRPAGELQRLLRYGDPGDHDLAHDHQHYRGVNTGGAPGLRGRILCPGLDPLADDLARDPPCKS